MSAESERLRESLRDEERELQRLQEQMRSLQAQKDALSASLTAAESEAEDSTEAEGEEEGEDEWEGEGEGEEPDSDSTSRFTNLLADLAVGLEDKLVQYLDNQRQRTQFLSNIRQLTGGLDEAAVGSVAESDESRPGNRAALQDWMGRVAAVLKPEPESDDDETEQQEGEDSQGTTEENVEENAAADYGTEQQTLSQLRDMSRNQQEEEKGEPQERMFRDASPEEQAEMLDRLGSLQDELAAMQQLQQQLHELEQLEALQQQQEEQLAVAAQVQNAQTAHQAANNVDSANDDNDDNDDDDDAPPSLIRAAGDNDEAERANMQEKLIAVNRLQDMLRSIAPGSLQGEEAFGQQAPQSTDTNAERVAAESISNENEAAEVAELLELQKQLHSLQQLQQTLAALDGGDGEPPDRSQLEEIQSLLFNMTGSHDESNREPENQPAESETLAEQFKPTSDEEAAIVQERLAEYAQAKAEMEAQRHELDSLRLEYAQLQQLEQQQQQMQAAQTEQSESMSSQTNAEVPPIPVANEENDSEGTNNLPKTAADEEQALLARLASLQQEHRRMEEERARLVEEAREHRQREQQTLLLQAQLLQRAEREQQQLNEEKTTEEQQDTLDYIGGGMSDLTDEDGEFDKEEAKTMMTYLEQQHASLLEQRNQLRTVVATVPEGAGVEQVTKIRETLVRIDALIQNVTVYHSFIAHKLEES